MELLIIMSSRLRRYRVESTENILIVHLIRQYFEAVWKKICRSVCHTRVSYRRKYQNADKR